MVLRNSESFLRKEQTGAYSDHSGFRVEVVFLC